MRWIVGTGRCGTRSCAEQLSGVHEPRPWIAGRSVTWALDGSHEEALLRLLEARSKLDVACVSCFQQTYVIPLVRRVDTNAEFTHVIREPLACVNSLTRSWRDQNGLNRIGWTDKQEDWQKAMGHYLAVNALLLARRLERRERWTVLRTECLGVHTNRGRTAWVLSDEQATEVRRRCAPLYDAVQVAS